MNKDETNLNQNEEKDNSIFDASDAPVLEAPEQVKTEKTLVKDLPEKETKEVDKSNKEEHQEEDPSKQVNDELEQYKKRYKDSKEWGQKTNITLINAKKKTSDFLKKLQDNGAIYDDEYKEALSYFNGVEDNSAEITRDNQPDPHIELKTTLDKEFEMFKRYNKVSNADDKYNAFFSFMNLSTPEEIEKIITYMKEEAPDKVIDHIMTVGTDLYEDLYKGIEESGDVLNYVKSLKKEKNKLEQKVKELQTELDGTTEKVYSRSINSKVSRSEFNKDKGTYQSIFDPT